MDNLKNLLNYSNNKLHFKEIELSKIVNTNKTPFYLYSEEILIYNLNQYKDAINKNKIDGLVCFALKSNNNLDLLKAMAKNGSGADIVSSLELLRALDAGIDSKKIVFSGVGKTEDDIRLGIEKNILSFNVESIEELELINSIGKELDRKVDVAFRLNPKVHAKTHKHISTGFKTHKFGILKEDILSAKQNSALWTNTNLIGLSVHIGSQLTDLEATLEAVNELCKLALSLGDQIKFVDVGGGLGVNYNSLNDHAPKIEHYIDLISEITKKSFKDIKVIFEPGRSISASAGFFISKVIRNKKSEDCNFLIVDGGMNDFVRPSLYDAYHEIYSSVLSDKLIETDIVGPICETADCFGQKRLLPQLSKDDFIVILDTGAYGFTMSSNYNMRNQPSELVISLNGEIKHS